jgi:RNA polymerase sigma-70 factor (ECF subfamily)
MEPQSASPEEQDELGLAEQAAHGDHTAFGVLVRRYESRLLAYLTNMLGDPELARDVAQETFLAAYRALPRWHPPEGATEHPLSPWLYRIATNRALSLLRESRRPASACHAPFEHAHDPPSEALISASFEDRSIARALLREALRQLSDEDAACLVLHFVSGERYSEIAARLNITAEAVRKRVARALVALRAAYTALESEVPS